MSVKHVAVSVLAASVLSTGASVAQAQLTGPVGPKAIAMADKKKASFEYAVSDGGRTACTLKTSLGDSSIDAAMCQLLERCVDDGNVAARALQKCLTPQVRRLTEMVDAGLIDELDRTQSSRSALQLLDDDDIVVEGQRGPRPGMWLMSEVGYVESNGTLLPTFTPIRQQSWRRCLTEGSIQAALADMMRVDNYEDEKSPCRWTISADGQSLSGTQMCTRPGAIQRAKVKGTFNAERLVMEKETRLTGLNPDGRFFLDGRPFAPGATGMNYPIGLSARAQTVPGLVLDANGPVDDWMIARSFGFDPSTFPNVTSASAVSFTRGQNFARTQVRGYRIGSC